MKIQIATKKEIPSIIKIAKELKEWFTTETICNIKVDLIINKSIISIENAKIVDFICYNSYNGPIKILWMGVSKRYHGRRIGLGMLQWPEREAKKYRGKFLEVETLSDEDKYEPYKQTRSFYYKNGFKRVEYRKARVPDWDDQILMEKKIS